jgi:A/G-specific adenine glycosylase
MPTATERTAKKPSQNFTAVQRRRIRVRLLGWYAENARDLPWRQSRDPYLVWVSEIMLQQTTVAAVRDYFMRFVAKFPDIASLAAADEEQVLRLWEGLGYYRRARQLHAAAKIVAEEHGGGFPRDLASLRQLPGVGRYTAGAIASIAFGERAPILEANTVRLLSRLIGLRDDPTKAAGQRLLWRTAEELLPRENVAKFNQALMELGALVCTPAEPRCEECPLAALCTAGALGLQHEIPPRKAKQELTELREVAVVVRRGGRILMRRCGESERWAGLWDFPRFAIDAEGPLFAEQEIVAKLRAQTGLTCKLGPLLKRLRHGITRYRITLDCYRAICVASGKRSACASEYRWIKAAGLRDLPLSTTGRTLALLVEKQEESLSMRQQSEQS